MTRLVRQINIAPGAPEDDVAPRPFLEFADRPNIVLLGDPGAGKKHLFREAAADEQARFISARAVLNTPADMLRGQALFIDGLDEKRADRGDRDTVDALVVKLFEVDPPKVRISCRAADWLGESDLAAMAPYFDQRGGASVLLLVRLSRAEQIIVLAGQGIPDVDAKRFLDAAAERGLGDFLENPQNLIMLRRAVLAGSWPATRRELFELSTSLMLQEPNGERARSGSGVFSVAELRPVAGAVCAARLIADVDAISLRDQEGTASVPGYRSLDLFPPGKIQAVLGRRVFDATSEAAEAVEYAHRTTAEFLAAEFLASRVREGLPFGRVVALMGVDGHPASELRGLHAWLAVHLPEHAEELIEGDPYGVLTYGDAASLSSSSCAALVGAIDRLSRNNPWFRSGNWQARAIGALARADMVSKFRAILNDPGSGLGVRSVVVDALALGTPLPEMLPDLEVVLARQISPYAERLGALHALLRLGDAGKASVRAVFDSQLTTAVNDLRLRAVIVQALYGDPYGPDDVVTLVDASISPQGTLGSGMFWSLAEAIPEPDLPAILDGIKPPAADQVGSSGRGWEVRLLYARILVRAWSGPTLFDPARVMRWLRKRLSFGGSLGESQVRDLRSAMRATPERLRALAEHFFEHMPVDQSPWLAVESFREATLSELGAGELAAIAVQALDAAETGSDRSTSLYGVDLSLSFQVAPSDGAAVFEDLYLRADSDAALRAARDASVVANLPANHYASHCGRAVQARDHRARQQQDFDQNLEPIRSGAHLGWLEHLARIYFALYADTDRSLSPRERISAWLGEERANAALEALAAALSRNDLPSFSDVMTLTANHKRYDWWYALVAGLSERWAAGEGLAILSDDFLKGMLLFDIANPVSTQEGGSLHWMIHPWRKALLEREPQLVRDAYLAIVKLRLSRKEKPVDGLSELLNEPAFEPYRSAIILDLPGEFPNADPFRLGEVLDAVAALPEAHQDFLQLAEPVTAGAVAVDQPQRDLWLATAYVVAPARFENDVRARAATRPELVFDLRDRSGFVSQNQTEHALPLPMAEFLARLTGSFFPDTPHLIGSWSGNTNAWDASDHFRRLVNMISASPSRAATDALQRLEGDPQLASYRPHLLYALDTQRQRRRESEYDRPDWPRTIAALGNRAPATVADLHALVLAQLRGLAHRVARSNTDIFKQFWNLDARGRPKEPRSEESCRDDIVTLLRPALLPVGVMIEPEGHMVADKRADISAAMPGRKILCELKRDYHAKVWSAVTQQLERFYAHDPEAKGFGIYMVFWFGANRPRQIPAPPAGMGPPKAAVEMEDTLRLLLPSDLRGRLAAVVVDVSGEV